MKNLILGLSLIFAAQNLWAAEKNYFCDVSMDKAFPASGVGDLEEVTLKNSAEAPEIFEGDVGVEGEAKVFITVNFATTQAAQKCASKLKVNLSGKSIEVCSDDKEQTPLLTFQKKDEKGELIELSVQCRSQALQEKNNKKIIESLDTNVKQVKKRQLTELPF